jgi:hypothetical protein
MPNITSTWNSGVSADWSVGTAWTPSGVPDATNADVLINAAGAYTVSIAGNESYQVDAVTLNDAGAVLSIAGTLDFAGSGKTLRVTAGTATLNGGTIADAATLTGMVGGKGTILGAGTLVNQGTLIANGGTNQDLLVLQAFSNAGTVIANNGFLGIEGTGLTNLSGNTLTGGTFIAKGSYGAVNILAIGVNFEADIATDAATVILDGAASEIEGWTGSAQTGSFQAIETQLQSIAATGTLQLLSNRGYTTTNTLTDSGSLILQGGILETGGLTVAAGGALTGYGVITGDVGNLGAITVTGTTSGVPTLQITGAVTGGGSVTVAAGDALILSGGSIGTLVNSGTVVDAGEVLTVKTVSGTGEIVVMKGGTAIVGGHTYAASGGATVIQGGTGTTSTNGMPVLTSMTNAVTTTTLSATTLSNIMADFSAAAANWGQYITSDLPLRISLILSDSASGVELAQGGPYGLIQTSVTLDARKVYEPDGMDAMTTGSYYPGLPFDIVVTLDANATNLSNFYINPNPAVRAANVALTGANRLKYDLESVFIHEIGHGLGMSGLMQQNGSFSSASETMYDHYVQQIITNGTVAGANFVGPHAEAAYGAELGTNVSTPVPLTFLDNGENFYHLANATSDFLDSDVMNGVGLSVGTAYAVSAVDLGIMADIGVPVTSGLVCYVQGTRIATPRGDVPIEHLAIGDSVLTFEGESWPIVWIGQRRIDCRRHANPLVAEPIRIARNAFGYDLPRRDLLVSPQHGLLVEGVLVPARLLVNGASIRREHGAGMVTYYHIELARHAILLAEGLPAESYLDTGNRGLFDNGGEILALHPDFAAITSEHAWAESACAPLAEDEPRIRPIRQRLAARATALGFALPDPTSTEDAALHLVIGDKTVRPMLQDRLRYVFVLPPGARVARVKSRSAQPCALYPWVEDVRRLGVQVRGIHIHTASGRRDMPVDHPALSEGWWAPERNGAALWRWTDGDARLSLGLDAVMLELTLAGTMTYPLDEGDRAVRDRAA